MQNVGVHLLGFQDIINAFIQAHYAGLAFIGTLIHNSVKPAYQIVINATVNTINIFFLNVLKVRQLVNNAMMIIIW